jgi:hypothetical protein
MSGHTTDFGTLLNGYMSLDYATMMASFETNPEAWPPAPPPNGTPARRLKDALIPLAEHAYWSRRTNEAIAKLGLGFVPGYVYGRAAALGEPPADVVVAALAVFEPRLLSALYEEARKQCGRTGLLAAREEATIDSLREILRDAEVTDVTQVVTVLRRGVDAATGHGRSLFSGLRSLGWPEHPAGKLWRACDLLLQHRGDSHTAVWLSAGLSPVSINLLTELWLGMPLGPYTSMRRGWSEESISAGLAELQSRHLVSDGELTVAGRKFRDEIEERTDALEQPVIDAIGHDFEATVTSLRTWSAACAEAGAFPPGAFEHQPLHESTKG